MAPVGDSELGLVSLVSYVLNNFQRNPNYTNVNGQLTVRKVTLAVDNI